VIEIGWFGFGVRGALASIFVIAISGKNRARFWKIFWGGRNGHEKHEKA
jgi:hypothetical protein